MKAIRRDFDLILVIDTRDTFFQDGRKNSLILPLQLIEKNKSIFLYSYLTT